MVRKRLSTFPFKNKFAMDQNRTLGFNQSFVENQTLEEFNVEAVLNLLLN